jgi:hypothetical protein
MAPIVEEFIKLGAQVLLQNMTAPSRVGFEKKIGGVAICGVLGFLGALAAVGCGVAALWLSLTPWLGSANAALICAATLLAFCAILAGVGYQLMRRTPLPPPPVHPVAQLLEGYDLHRIFEKHAVELILGALVGGLLLGLKKRDGH